jgi:hypothetical protein
LNYYSATVKWGGGYASLGTYAAMTEDEDDAQDLSGVTRVEVIDRVGRAYTNYGVSLVDLDVQDEGRTLKVFVN